MKKIIIKFLVFLLAIVTPFTAYSLVVDLSIPNPYHETFFGEMPFKYSLMKNTTGKKIVFVGCSSLPFGLRSDVVDQEFPDYKVVNYGLYGAIGTKFMMETSKVNINKGDIIILAPEISEQTYSSYFNPDIALEATDGLSEMYRHFDFNTNVNIFAKFIFGYSFEKLSYYHNNNAPDPIGIYRRDSFNEYGDIYVERESNIMMGGYDHTMLIEPTTDLITDDFVNMVNDYIKFVRKRGAEIYFNFSPCNDMSIGVSKNKRDAFENLLKEKINCETLMDLDSCLLHYLYFYDTNFHLNSTGALQFTNLVVAALKDKLGIEHDPVIDIPPVPPEEEEVPEIIPEEPTEFEKYRGEPNNDYLNCFNYRQIGSYYRIESVKDEYVDMENVILPAVYEGKTIKAVAKNAFEKCKKLQHIYVGLNIRSIEEKAFNGCESLLGIHLFQMDGSVISVPTEGLLDGCNDKVKIYIPKGSNYAVGYIWDYYSSYFVEVEFNEE